MIILYKEKAFEVVKVWGTYTYYYLIVKLTEDNTDTFLNVIKEKDDNYRQSGSLKEHLYKENYKGCRGMVPVDVENGLGIFRLDMWIDDENKRKYENGELYGK